MIIVFSWHFNFAVELQNLSLINRHFILETIFAVFAVFKASQNRKFSNGKNGNYLPEVGNSNFVPHTHLVVLGSSINKKNNE